MKLSPTVNLNNGYDMPILGLGANNLTGNEGEFILKYAIDIGYRHFDTAYFYQNEAEVGKAIRDKIAEGVVKREDIFLVTKLWNIYHDPERVEFACRKQLKIFGLDYIDLYLIHTPVGYKYVDEDTLQPKDESGGLELSDVDYLDTYKAMEKLVKLGLVRSIGVSNFNSEQLTRLLENCEIKPVTNQVEYSPSVNQKELAAFCKERGVTITAYAPLGKPMPNQSKPKFLTSSKVKDIAKKYNKTTAQVVLRYLVQSGVLPIPKSANPGHLAENLDIFSFDLTKEEKLVLDGFHTGERTVSLMNAKDHKYFPFGVWF